MNDFWRSKNTPLAALAVCCLYLQSLSVCLSLNDEGVALLRFKENVISDPFGALSNWIDEDGIDTPCFWFGVGCSEGYVVSLNSLGKKEAPHRKLLQETPREQRRGWRFLLQPILAIRNSISPSLSPSPPPSPSSSPSPSPSPSLSPFSSPSLSLSPAPSPSPVTLAPSSSPSLSPVTHVFPPSLPTPTESHGTLTENSKKSHRHLILYPAIGGPVFFLLLILFFYFKSGKVAAVNPWATGLSGPLRRAFVTGVSKLQRTELEVACEDFSNVIGSSSVCTLYKGTLSSGVEIAVASIATGSAKDWKNSEEAQFRKKIDTLSKVTHKNFVSLLGYCEEEEPFTRMMVFEYAPNGTLFEHIHVREAEHLDWEARLRVAMGVAYCLEHMHSLTPSLAHNNLISSSIYLTEDYAAKLADFVLLDEKAAAETKPNTSSNVYSFGVVLFEMITGKLPYAVGNSDSLQDWASDYLRGVQSLRETIDPTLKTYGEDQVRLIDGLIRSCCHPDSTQRPAMGEVCVRLREITGIEPEEAIPKSSPLWWAELEIVSTDAN